MFKKIKKSLNAYIERLAKENEKTYGKNRINCCDLNENNKKSN